MESSNAMRPVKGFLMHFLTFPVTFLFLSGMTLQVRQELASVEANSGVIC